MKPNFSKQISSSKTLNWLQKRDTISVKAIMNCNRLMNFTKFDNLYSLFGKLFNCATKEQFHCAKQLIEYFAQLFWPSTTWDQLSAIKRQTSRVVHYTCDFTKFHATRKRTYHHTHTQTHCAVFMSKRAPMSLDALSRGRRQPHLHMQLRKCR